MVDETGPVVEGEVGGGDGAHAWRDGLAHQNPFGPLFASEELVDEEDTALASVEGGYVAAEPDVCLGGTVWRKWTRPPRDDEVFLGGTVWRKWARVVAEPGDWTVRVGCGKPRSRRRTGCRRSRNKNRRRREKQRRRTLRHKKRHRRGRAIRPRRRRVSFRGGAKPDADTLLPSRRSGRECVPTNLDIKERIQETHVFNRNLAAAAAAIHKTNNYDAREQRERGDRKAKEIKERTEKLLRQRIEQLPSSTRSATLGDLLAFSKKDGEEPEPVCKECEQHFDGDLDKISCDICDGVFHPCCAVQDHDGVVRNGINVLCNSRVCPIACRGCISPILSRFFMASRGT